MTRSTARPRSAPLGKSGGEAFERIVIACLGLLLMVAGALKLMDFFMGMGQDDFGTLALTAFAEAELLIGLWFVIDARSGATRPWALAITGGLVLASLAQILAGHCVCNRFGDRGISPWLALTIDFVVLGALIGARRVAPTPSEGNKRLTPAILTLIVALFGTLEAGRVTVAGTAEMGGRPLSEATLIFVGNSGPITVHTAPDGHFQLPAVQPGMYFVSTTAPTADPIVAPQVKGKRSSSKPSGKAQVDPSHRDKPVEPSAWFEVSPCGARETRIVLDGR